MAKAPNLPSLSGFFSNTQINEAFEAIEDAFENTLSLDGSTPNALEADLDLNGNKLLNVDTIDVDNLTLNGQVVTGLATVPEYKSNWLTATSYAVNDLVKINGNVYICLENHTSGTFSTDLTALKWEVFVTKGDSGVGSGDLVSTNNLSDLDNVATARSNLGLGDVAVENVLTVAKGGTGAATASSARTNLGLGTAAVANLLDEDDFASDSNTATATQQSIKAYIASQLAAITDDAPRITASGYVTLSAGVPTLTKGFNVASITDNGVGIFTVNFTDAEPDTYYHVSVSVIQSGSLGYFISTPSANRATTGFRVTFINTAGTPTDVTFSFTVTRTP